MAESQAFRVLREAKGLTRYMRLSASLDGLAARLTLVPTGMSTVVPAEEITSFLRDSGVVAGLQSEAVLHIANAASHGKRSDDVTVARGRPPVPGEPGAIELFVRANAESAPPPEVEGRVDWRAAEAVENVLVDQPVAIEIPPKPGQPGLSVLGRELRPTEGEPARSRSGAGVRFDPESRQFFATREGRLLWRDGEFSVTDQYEVDRNVDLTVGNVAFVGAVTIGGDVLDGFTVSAGKGLVVGGTVGAAKIDTEGDLIVRGGLAGKGRGRARAKGTARLRYVNDGRVEAGGDLTVEREAMNSQLLANRRLIVAGSFVGGEATSLAGIEAGTIGSALGVATRVNAGVDCFLEERRREIEKRLAEIDRSVEKIRAFLGPLMSDRARLARVLERRREEITRLAGALRSLRDEREGEVTVLREILETSRHAAVRQINVRKRLHPGVLVELGRYRRRFRSGQAGPLTLLEDPERGTIRVETYRPLRTPEKSGAATKGESHGI